jgi:hypothetical protein
MQIKFLSQHSGKQGEHYTGLTYHQKFSKGLGTAEREGALMVPTWITPTHPSTALTAGSVAVRGTLHLFAGVPHGPRCKHFRKRQTLLNLGLLGEQGAASLTPLGAATAEAKSVPLLPVPSST